MIRTRTKLPCRKCYRRASSAFRHHDARLQAQRNDHALCRTERVEGRSHRPVHEAPPSSGVPHFLKTINRSTPKNLDIHCIADNYATHKKREIHAWLEKHPRFHFHFIPTSSSWLNLVEPWFAEITRKRIRRGVFTSVAELEQAIYDYIQHNNANPKPFVWTKKADDIIQKVNRCKVILKTLH
jgi:transposase